MWGDGRITSRNEFLAAIELLYRGDVQPERMKGSWAGAFGPTQFMPTVYKNYAVDADGDGHPRHDHLDAGPLVLHRATISAVTAGKQDRLGATKVVVPKNFNFMLADRNKVLTIREWEQLGIRRAGDKPFPRVVRQGVPDGPGGQRRDPAS